MSLSLRELQAMGPRTPYAANLLKEFGIEVPAGAPKYQAEYLYKYARQEKSIELATAKAASFFARFPWIAKKYDDVTIKVRDKTNSSLRENSASYPDGTIVHCVKRNKYLLYIGGKIAVRCSTVDKVKALALKKLNFKEFI